MTTTAQDAHPMWPLELAAPGVHRVLPAPDVAVLQQILEEIGELGSGSAVGRGADAARIDALSLLERVKGAVAAAQARITRDFEASQLQQQDAEIERCRADGEAGDLGQARRARRLTRERGRGIGDQVALARRAPASQGSRQVGFAQALAEMPHTAGLLASGEIGEWAATVLVRESAVLSLEDRARFDESLCALRVDTTTGVVQEPRALTMSVTRLAGEARSLADELDPAAAVRRRSKSEQERRVTVRPTPDTMVFLTGLLPVTQGVAAFANLQASAKRLKAAGDERSLAQIMADLMVTRLTGQESAGAVPCEIGLVMGPGALVGASDQAAQTRDGRFRVPAQVVRDLAERSDAPTWLRRIFADPATGVVVDVDTKRRAYHTASATFVAYRDKVCRHPGCESPIQVVDHAERHADGGPTTRANAQGLCEGHNLVKEMPGWRTRVSDPRPGHHTVETVTPTGHVYRSHAPPAMPRPG